MYIGTTCLLSDNIGIAFPVKELIVTVRNILSTYHYISLACHIIRTNTYLMKNLH